MRDLRPDDAVVLRVYSARVRGIARPNPYSNSSSSSSPSTIAMSSSNSSLKCGIGKGFLCKEDGETSRIGECAESGVSIPAFRSSSER